MPAHYTAAKEKKEKKDTAEKILSYDFLPVISPE